MFCVFLWGKELKSLKKKEPLIVEVIQEPTT